MFDFFSKESKFRGRKYENSRFTKRSTRSGFSWRQNTQGHHLGNWSLGKKVSKSNRRGCPEDIPKFLTKLLFATLALCNSLAIDATEVLVTKYPGVCPWCGNVPCQCSKGRKRGVHHSGPSEEKANLQPVLPLQYDTLDLLQQMIDSIYPETPLWEICTHCLEEAWEVAEAVHTAPQEQEGEIADLLAKVFGVAQALGRSLLDIVQGESGVPSFLVLE